MKPTVAVAWCLLLVAIPAVVTAEGGCDSGNRIEGDWQGPTAMALLIVAYSALGVGLIMHLIIPAACCKGMYQSMDSSGVSLWKNFVCWKHHSNHFPISIYVLLSLVFGACGIGATWMMEGYHHSGYGQTTFRALMTAAFILYIVSAYGTHGAHDFKSDDDSPTFSKLRSPMLMFVHVAMWVSVGLQSTLSAQDKDGSYGLYGFLGFLMVFQSFSIVSHHHMLFKAEKNEETASWVKIGHVICVLVSLTGLGFLATAQCRLPCVNGANS